MAESTNKPTRFEPQAAAASQRMADSVFDRLSAGTRAPRGLSSETAPSGEGWSRAMTLQTALGPAGRCGLATSSPRRPKSGPGRSRD